MDEGFQMQVSFSLILMFLLSRLCICIVFNLLSYNLRCFSFVLPHGLIVLFISYFSCRSVPNLSFACLSMLSTMFLILVRLLQGV